MMEEIALSLGDERTVAGDSVSGGFAFSAGTHLGQYRVIRTLGRGGMGEVYEVRHEILQTRHALKLMPAERSGVPGFVSRFRDEARVMARLCNPGICHVTHADVTDGYHYLVMDLVTADGGNPFDLEEALAVAEGGCFAPGDVARLGIQIAEAVGFAHKHGVVHRDLKPSNILLSSRDISRADVRVADFGLARLVGEDWVRSIVELSVRQSMSIDGMRTMERPRSERSSTGAILGTYDYMSPEQREGREADERSDIYALGVMFYRMVTGKRLMGRAKAASRIVPGLDPRWDNVIDSCLEESVEDRISSMDKVVDALRLLVGVTRREHNSPVPPPLPVVRPAVSASVSLQPPPLPIMAMDKVNHLSSVSSPPQRTSDLSTSGVGVKILTTAGIILFTVLGVPVLCMIFSEIGDEMDIRIDRLGGDEETGMLLGLLILFAVTFFVARWLRKNPGFGWWNGHILLPLARIFLLIPVIALLSESDELVLLGVLPMLVAIILFIICLVKKPWRSITA